METIKTLLQALMLAVVATVVVSTLSGVNHKRTNDTGDSTAAVHLLDPASAGSVDTP